jgi:hypothetical protein
MPLVYKNESLFYPSSILMRLGSLPVILQIARWLFLINKEARQTESSSLCYIMQQAATLATTLLDY